MILPAAGLLINHPCSSADSGTTTNAAQQTTSVVFLSSTPGTAVTSNSGTIQQIASALHHSSTIQPTTSVASLTSTPGPAISDTTIQSTTNAVYRSSIGVISDILVIGTFRQTASVSLNLSSTPTISTTTQQLTTTTVIHSPSPMISEMTTKNFQTATITSAVYSLSTSMTSNTTKMVSLSSQAVRVLVESNPPLLVNPGTRNVGLIIGIATVAVVVVVSLGLLIIVVGVTILCKKARKSHRLNDKVTTTSNEAYGAIPVVHVVEDDTYDYPMLNYQAVMDTHINTAKNEAYATNAEAIRSMLHHH